MQFGVQFMFFSPFQVIQTATCIFLRFSTVMNFLTLVHFHFYTITEKISPRDRSWGGCEQKARTWSKLNTQSKATVSEFRNSSFDTRVVYMQQTEHNSSIMNFRHNPKCSLIFTEKPINTFKVFFFSKLYLVEVHESFIFIKHNKYPTLVQDMLQGDWHLKKELLQA